MTNAIVVGIAGKARAGKDSFACFLADAFNSRHERYRARVVSLAAPLKEMLVPLIKCFVEDNPYYYVHFDKKDEPLPGLHDVSPRRLMQTLGTEWGRHIVDEDLWCEVLDRKVAEFEKEINEEDKDLVPVIIVPDVRFDNEAAYTDYMYLVNRALVQEVEEHYSELGISEYLIKRTIDNNGSLAALKKKAQGLVQEIDDEITKALEEGDE